MSEHSCTIECVDECRYCHKDYCIESGYGGNNEDVNFCSKGCMENWTEAAYERRLEDYYGGDGPLTALEQEIEAYNQKYGVGGTHR